MKNKPNHDIFWKQNVKKIFLTMQISFLLIALTVMNAYSTSIFSQNAKVSINMQNATVREVVGEIEKQGGINFLFNDNLPGLNQHVSVSFIDQPIKDVLEDALSQADMMYEEIKDGFVVLLTTPENSYKQQITITGRVVDTATDEPLPGASIVVQGTTIGTITGVDGDYSLSVPSRDAVLVFSFIGYITRDILVGDNNIINVTLSEDVRLLDEIVVIGYGVQRKSDLTGAVATMSTDDLAGRPVVSVAEAMVGQMAGVHIQQTSGRPGAGLDIRIRGTASITQSNTPLYVVDGYPMESDVFRMVSPSDIESIQVLKDASSTAIYGSRGANGVVIITTKKGEGAPSVNFRMQTGVQQLERKVEMMNRDQYIEFFNDGRNQAWLDAAIIAADPDKSPHTVNDPNSRRSLYPNASNQYMIPDGTGGYLYNFLDPQSVAQMPDNDWQDLLYRNARIQQYDFSFSGGSERTQYAFTANYVQQDGIVLNTDHERFGFRANINTAVNDRFRMGVNISTFLSGTNEQAEGKDAPPMYALNLPPIFPLHNPDGTYGSTVRNYEIFAGDVASPVGIAEQISDFRRRHGWMGILFAELEVLRDLNYRISINGGMQENNRNYYLPSYVDLDGSRAPRIAQGISDKISDMDWVIENTLTYQKTFSDKHNITALAGYSTQKNYYHRLDGQARNFPNDNIYTLNAGTMFNLSSTESEYSMISYLARVNYVYADKYMFSAAFRTDGSSRFGKENRWGNFPSISAAWRISQESFMQNIESVNELKIRASYGIAGNNRIGNYSAIALLGTGYYPTGDQIQTTVDPNTMPNDYLGWERVEQINFGLDLGLFSNRIRFESDFYDSKSIDLLMSVPVPILTGYSSQMQNVGKVQNRGMEFQLSTRNLVREFQWTSSFNISFNKNKVLELGPDERPILASAPNAGNSFITMIGQPIASYYGYVYQGVFLTQEELDRYVSRPTDKVGDGRFLDVNGDGRLDANDKEILGDNHPIFTAGLSNNFEYKNFALGVQLTGSYGADIFSIFKRMIGVYHGDRNGMIALVNRWRSPDDPGDGYHFRASRTPVGWQRDPSSIWLEDGSFLRIRHASLTYNFDQSMIQNLNIPVSRIGIYITGQNLYTWTNYSGYDPETSSQGSGLTKGGDYMGYPTSRSIVFGVNASF